MTSSSCDICWSTHYAHCPFFVGMPSLCYYSGGLDSTFLQDMRIKQSFSGFHSSEIKNYAQVNISIENLSFAPLPPNKTYGKFHMFNCFFKASLRSQENLTNSFFVGKFASFHNTQFLPICCMIKYSPAEFLCKIILVPDFINEVVKS